ncbi:hypothetical protein, variant 2 [Aphanomyces invadans]|uniref:Uncharacterized protein n=1 Tax=Aphanomyces invadans TaxID=157072 RepID=A0A024TMD1_9STRA|nr:hypothetical protein H310_11205 [Aphanomyces invadans]XP_008876007.1 hypothetical protein, variant 1 [Aphanomyces invadans]XP_008876008.1 hypothetical protein, variant 2 [Aphanomyces invadans]ETV95305.1 hypothetical protein H310_11205 [Aphanomyces invadans]ETV95306.1 hypothetical protein, variant 1 [Aphanomyces invadans]ETV95307.1 hypothetical protein, variant 2 [Aphanomyces invadans]|eukprot:XP_008876006.1 hypothetical protein H310_11205 [Aphanomyces invadans]
MHLEHLTESQWGDLEADMMCLVDEAMQSTPQMRTRPSRGTCVSEYMELSYCDTTDALRTPLAHYFRGNLLHATTLALKLQVAQLRNQRRVLFIARESLNLEDYPPVDHVVRFHFKTLLLQTHGDDYIADALHLLSSPLGNLQAFVFNKVAHASMYIVDAFPLLLQKMRLLHALVTRAPPKKQSEFQWTVHIIYETENVATVLCVPTLPIRTRLRRMRRCAGNASFRFHALCLGR